MAEKGYNDTAYGRGSLSDKLIKAFSLREGNEPITSLLVVGDCPEIKEKQAVPDSHEYNYKNQWRIIYK